METTEIPTGCYVDNTWGIHSFGRVCVLAKAFGWNGLLDEDTTEFGVEEWSFYADEADAWLNDYVALDGHSFGWHEGEYHYQTQEWWSEV